MYVLAVAPRRAGRFSVITVSATGMQAPSPSPARNRKTANIATFGASGMTRVKIEKTRTEPISIQRRPNRSVNGPSPAAPTATPTSDSVATRVAPAAVKPRCWLLSRVGIAAPSATRS
ncbi:hypothetical protein AOZ06_31405 [Kibdelosporangium phytohabitans]|uniref:Uncharacterized protein n=1 Tax=Kibdelosporangium phytohabitans TaxID=860235 RepID=A0A0N9I7B3_9PSEU|nr:hypothetical protein AOZ06_31405 [Kibdelosporangium phytohabitans]